MKTACFFAAAALAGATAPPQISLQLEGMTSAYKLKESIDREHDQGLVHNDGKAVKSRQDWTEKCAAVKSVDSDGVEVPTTKTNCPFPVARGYDHHDSVVRVTTRVYRVDLDGTPQAFDVEKDQIKLNAAGDDFANQDMWKHRSTFLFKYDATDKAGNHADQVVFALILDDTSKPIFDQKVSGKACLSNTGTWAPSITVQAVSDWKLCKFSVTDNVDVSTANGLQKETDASQTRDIKYQVNYLGREHPAFKLKAGETSWHGSTYKAVSWTGFGSQPTSDLSYNAAANLFGANANGADRVGKFLVTATIDDFANVYGHNNLDNSADVTTAILVEDNGNNGGKPVIRLDGFTPKVQECDSRNAAKYEDCDLGNDDFAQKCYIEAGAKATDALDTVALGQYLPVTVSLAGESDVVIAKNQADSAYFYKGFSDTLTKLKQGDTCKTERNLEYNTQDFALNSAPTVVRKVTTVDTTAPKVELLGNTKQEYKYCQTDCGGAGKEDLKHCEGPNHHLGDLDGVDPGATCSDRCDTSVGPDSVEMSWGPRTFNARVLGDYVRTYSCKDSCGLENKVTRTVTVEDCGVPSLSFQGDEIMTVKASRDIEYTDAGALCSDWVDGELSHAVEVSGDVVNMRIPGTYNINYNCQDLTGNDAAPLTRTVFVEDTTRPTMVLKGATVNYIEAGFPYIDAGATASDDLDGDITQYIWTDGDTVTDQRAFYAYHSCAAMQAASKTALHNGDYYVTTRSNGKFTRQLIHCVFKGTSSTFGFKITQSACADIGMTTGLSAAQMAYVKEVTTPHEYATIGNGATHACKDDETSVDKNTLIDTQTLKDSIRDAEQGRYVIQFHVEDKAGNKHCENTAQLPCLKRTVIVKDTLPPVVSLSVQAALKSQTVPAAAAATASSLHGHDNYMAESNTSSNGFIVGAIASAVAGVALLGVSMRKTTTTVPV